MYFILFELFPVNLNIPQKFYQYTIDDKITTVFPKTKPQLKATAMASLKIYF